MHFSFLVIGKFKKFDSMHIDACKKIYRYYHCSCCNNRIGEIQLELSLGEYIIEQQIRQFDQNEYKKLVKVMRTFEQNVIAINDLYDKRIIGKKSKKSEIARINQQRQNYLQDTSTKHMRKSSWFDLKIQQKIKVANEYIKQVDVSLKSKSIVKIYGKDDTN